MATPLQVTEMLKEALQHLKLAQQQIQDAEAVLHKAWELTPQNGFPDWKPNGNPTVEKKLIGEFDKELTIGSTFTQQMNSVVNNAISLVYMYSPQKE